jgi:hypothetical protein
MVNVFDFILPRADWLENDTMASRRHSPSILQTGLEFWPLGLGKS